MYKTEWQAAVANLLDYCRDPRHVLSAGRQLGPVLLQGSCPTTGSGWKFVNEWALAAALKAMIEGQIAHLRALAKIHIPVSDNPDEHVRALKHDVRATQGRGELKFWSLLWAYYICGMSHEEIARACGCSTRLSQLRVKEGREIYLVHRLAALVHAQERSR